MALSARAAVLRAGAAADAELCSNLLSNDYAVGTFRFDRYDWANGARIIDGRSPSYRASQELGGFSRAHLKTGDQFIKACWQLR
jgi:hypothetical protein